MTNRSSFNDYQPSHQNRTFYDAKPLHAMMKTHNLKLGKSAVNTSTIWHSILFTSFPGQ